MAGVLGVVPGIMGLLQANEVLKVLLGIGDTLAGRLLLFDALEAAFTELKLRRDPTCPVCSEAAVEAPASAARRSTLSAFAADAPFVLSAGFGTGPGGARPPARPRRGMSTVFIPAVLRPAVGGVKRWSSGARPSARSSAALVERHPGLRGQLLTRDGELNRFVNVYVNGQDVRYLNGLATPVEERDEVRLLPAMAGG